MSRIVPRHVHNAVRKQLSERLGHHVDLTWSQFRRAKLWLEDPHCHFCGCLTVWWTIGGPQPDNAATIEHLYPRGDPLRGTTRQVSTVLACFACNRDRSREHSRKLAALSMEASTT